MGIFAGSGVGKSTILSMMARYTNADVTVAGCSEVADIDDLVPVFGRCGSCARSAGFSPSVSRLASARRA